MKRGMWGAFLLSGVSISIMLAGGSAATALQTDPRANLGSSPRTGKLETPGPRPDIFAFEPNDSKGRMPVLACGKGQVLDLSIGTAGWVLKLPDGSFAQIVPLSSSSWPLLTGAAWHGPPNGAAGSYPVGYYHYGLKVMIEPCKSLPPVLDVKYMSDNQATLIFDGTIVQQQGGTPYYGFLPGGLTSYQQVLPTSLSGTHTIIVRVENRSGANKPYATPTGVSARISLSR